MRNWKETTNSNDVYGVYINQKSMFYTLGLWDPKHK